MHEVIQYIKNKIRKGERIMKRTNGLLLENLDELLFLNH